ncbi:MAG: adenylate/guanylate cyclase domain-containing protein [Pseudomonadota bacterium]
MFRRVLGPSRRRLGQRRRPPIAALGVALPGLAVAVAVLVTLAAQTAPLETLRDRLFDLAMAQAPAAAKLDLPIVVVIDRQSLALIGPWPWPRDRLAALIGAIAAAEPEVIGIDILLEGADQSSPAALARQLATYLPDAGLAARAARLPDGDAALAKALRAAPSVLGLALDPTRKRAVPRLAPILARPPIRLDGAWQAQGLIAPHATLAAAAEGLGVLSLPGDGDATVRRVPLVLRAGDVLAPGLALEVLRVSRGGAPVLLDGPAARLRLSGGAIPFDATAMLRLIPLSEAQMRRATVSAAALLAGAPEARTRLAGAVVFLGAAAPELGGLRPGPGDRLLPAILLQAGAYAQLDAGLWPTRPGWAGWAEPLAVFLASLLAALAAWRLTPLAGALCSAAAASLWTAGALAAALMQLRLLDPIAPACAAIATFVLSAIWVATAVRRQAGRIRLAFEQHLAPDVVQRLADAPDRLRLAGERREVTALFSDIEGFTAMTERAAPEALIALLDRYFDGMAQIIVAHGGMIDKIVGDAIHAFFNLPFDKIDHQQAAFDCACAMADLAQQLVADDEARALGLGRTRIGIETGPVIAGNVGGVRKLDYTAHGPAVNAAARLEAANKILGTTILVGPGAAAGIASAALMPLGPVPIRGFAKPLSLFTPWPAGMDRAAYAAWKTALIASDHDGLEALAARQPWAPQLAKIAAALR